MFKHFIIYVVLPYSKWTYYCGIILKYKKEEFMNEVGISLEILVKQ